MGAVFAMEGQFDAPASATLEAITAQLNERLPPLTEFVLPGGGAAAAQAHICRAVCRRAEIDLWGLLAGLTDPPHAMQDCARYLNRLSDYFFVLARSLSETAETEWDRG